MSASLTLRIRLGPLVYLEVEGDNCEEISEALTGYETLNQKIDALCSDLAERVYPEGTESARTGREEEVSE
ncbi:MAG: hypothetical protein Kow0042_31740 [Calditrichia bacterium]